MPRLSGSGVSLEDMRTSLKESFWNHVVPEPNTGCWLWTGELKPSGYARFTICRDGKKKKFAAHRFAYEVFIGPIPSGLQIDHLCRVRSCINPLHLEAVTQRENLLRGVGPSAINARKIYCTNGHRLPEIPTYYRCGPERVCIICKRELERARRRTRWQQIRRS